MSESSPHGDVTVRKRGVERVEVVERHHPGGQRWIDLRPDRSRTTDDRAVRTQDREGLVDRAVVTPVDHGDLRAIGEVTDEAQYEPVRVVDRPTQQRALRHRDRSSLRCRRDRSRRGRCRRHRRTPHPTRPQRGSGTRPASESSMASAPQQGGGAARTRPTRQSEDASPRTGVPREPPGRQVAPVRSQADGSSYPPRHRSAWGEMVVPPEHRSGG